MYYFFIIYKMASQAGSNCLVGQIWPVARTLEIPELEAGLH